MTTLTGRMKADAKTRSDGGPNAEVRALLANGDELARRRPGPRKGSTGCKGASLASIRIGLTALILFVKTEIAGETGC